MSCLLPSSIKTEVIKNSDSMSEVSESGTNTSGWPSNWDSREDLRDFMTKLGLKEVTDLHQDRFRVDRRKLEQMLTGDNDALFPADVFFSKIMEDTDTYITWPNKLKIGAKSKKDPHVRVAGRPEDVQAAKERILTILDTRCNRITMKMDVSYTDHSHIIGRGGLSIRRVMDETRCHVHFPDSNRSNALEKSNQVSVSGDIDGVECARSRVRELIPLIFGFELPVMSQNIDTKSPYVQKIEDQYNVQVMMKTRPKLHATLVLVKGVEWEVNQVKHATLLLMEYMCEKLASQIPVQMSMEISPHHHSTILGKNHSNLKAIMQYTSCQIMFPDAQDPNIPNLKKSNVNITGNIHNVYKARQLLMGSLPLIIIFDLPDDLNIKQDLIGDIQSSCEVQINVRQKANKTTKACVIKGIERHADNIYKARNLLLGTNEPALIADIPSSYLMPENVADSSVVSALDLLTPTNILPPPMSPMWSPLISPTWPYHSPNPTQNSPFVGMTQQPTFLYNVVQHQQAAHQHYQQCESLRPSLESSGYQSMALSDQGNEGRLHPGLSTNNSEDCSSPRNCISPIYYKSYSGSPSDKFAMGDTNISGEYHGHTISNRQEYKSPSCDYESKRFAGLRAMQQRPTANSYRIPTGCWSGYGISHTSPANTIPRTKKEEDIWKTSSNQYSMFPVPSSSEVVLNTSNMLDQMPSYIWNRMSNTNNWPNLPTMLTAMGLDRYVTLFRQHEIDLATFSTLTDQDLVEIGITAFGARRRMLLAIFEMNKKANSPFSAAPGAERKSSSSSNSTASPKQNW